MAYIKYKIRRVLFRDFQRMTREVDFPGATGRIAIDQKRIDPILRELVNPSELQRCSLI